METPQELKYTKDHEWIRMTDEKTEDGKSIALIGITDFAQSELGELVYVEVDTVDDEVEKDEVFGTVEAVKTTSDLFMPVSGTVLEFNPALDESEGDDPALINSDPYHEGWIIKISINDDAEIADLLDAEAYKSLIA